jgi:hypothetical protein
MFDWFFNTFGRSKTTKPTVTKPAPAPTLEKKRTAYNFIFHETIPVYEAEKVRVEKEVVAAWNRFVELREGVLALKNLPSETAEQELKGRHEAKRRREALRAAEKKHEDLSKENRTLLWKFQREERSRYLIEGEEIFRGQWTSFGPASSRRVVVKWRQKILLLMQTADNEYVHLYRQETPNIEWATDSLNQFNEEELQAVARFQSMVTQ